MAAPQISTFGVQPQPPSLGSDVRRFDLGVLVVGPQRGLQLFGVLCFARCEQPGVGAQFEGSADFVEQALWVARGRFEGCCIAPTEVVEALFLRCLFDLIEAGSGSVFDVAPSADVLGEGGIQVAPARHRRVRLREHLHGSRPPDLRQLADD